MSFSDERTIFTILRHNGNGIAAAAQTHTSHLLTAINVCSVAILHPGYHFVRTCIMQFFTYHNQNAFS